MKMPKIARRAAPPQTTGNPFAEGRPASAQTGNPFDEVMSDREYQERRNIGPRAAQLERQQGTGPPYIKIGKQILYFKVRVAAWLREQERHPPRRRGEARRGT
jgi:hypothetical protein